MAGHALIISPSSRGHILPMKVNLRGTPRKEGLSDSFHRSQMIWAYGFVVISCNISCTFHFVLVGNYTYEIIPICKNVIHLWGLFSFRLRLCKYGRFNSNDYIEALSEIKLVKEINFNKTAVVVSAIDPLQGRVIKGKLWKLVLSWNSVNICLCVYVLTLCFSIKDYKELLRKLLRYIS